MKNITTYITEYLINTNSVGYKRNDAINNIFNGIDISEWKWPAHGVPDSELNDYKKNVQAFANELFPNTEKSSSLELLYRETYKKYVLTYWKKSNDELENYINKEFNIIDKYGFAQYEWSNLPQGWWHFMNWVIKNRK